MHQTLNEAEKESYHSLKHKPLDNTLYEIFNIDIEKEFNPKQNHRNMLKIVRKFHPDKQEDENKKKICNDITKILTETWRIIDNPRIEICYRILGKKGLEGMSCINWSEINKAMGMIQKEWNKINANTQQVKNENITNPHPTTTQTQTKAGHKQHETKPPTKRKRSEPEKPEPTSTEGQQTENNSSQTNEKENGKENTNKKPKISKIIKIIDHYYRHGKYMAKVKWDDDEESNVELDSISDNTLILQEYLTNLLKYQSKRYSWLKKNKLDIIQKAKMS